LTLCEDLLLLGHILFSWHTAVFFLLLALSGAIFYTPTWLLGDTWLTNTGSNSWRDVIPAAIGVVLGLLCMIAACSVLSHNSRQRTNAALRRMGFPTCVTCQYDLKGLADDPKVDRCPECGAIIADMPPVGKRRA
jgi:hypothetical protein